ncbi:MAG: FIST C-terminal domain-containing protein [Deltaproteobacteria bacterium]|nr:FIST C-terminal domain-containing protein [Deltaproteobacteria bacterium]
MRAGAGLSRKGDVRDAAREAVQQALDSAGLSQADCLLLAATAQHLDEAIDLCEVLREVAGAGVRIVGGCASQVFLPGDEQEDGPALGVLAIEGPAHPFVFKPGDSASLAEAAQAAGPSPLCLVFADPSAAVPRLVQALAREAPGAQVAGGGVVAEGGLVLDDDLVEAAAVGLFLPGPARVGVAQGHQPVGKRLLVTAADGRMIRELDGRAAVELLAALEAEPGMQDLSSALPFLALAAAPAPGEEFKDDDFVTLPLLGVDEDTGGLAVGGPISEGTQVTFALRDGMGARRATERMLETLATQGKPQLGVYFDCSSRGSALYGIEGLDLSLIKKSLGSFPLLGLRTSFELGPAGASVGLHVYTGILGLI